MRAFDGSPAEMPIVPDRADWRSPDEATAERLLSGYGADPGAPREEHALALLLGAAARPATLRELSGEQAAVAAFELAVRRPRSRLRAPAWASFWRTRFSRARRVPVLISCGVLAVAAALSGTAAAGDLPAPLQSMAHSVFGAPAPAPTGPRPSVSRQSPSAGYRARAGASASPPPGLAKARKASASGRARGHKKSGVTVNAQATPGARSSPRPKPTQQASRTAKAAGTESHQVCRLNGTHSCGLSRRVKTTPAPVPPVRQASAPPGPPSRSQVRLSARLGTARAPLRRLPPASSRPAPYRTTGPADRGRFGPRMPGQARPPWGSPACRSARRTPGRARVRCHLGHASTT